MGTRAKVRAAAAILAALAVLLPPPVRGGAFADGKPGVGDAAPPFTADDLGGNKVSLEDALKSGRVVLLNFWGLRCSNCIVEIGHLNPMYDRLAPRGAVFLGVNVDGAPGDAIARLMPKMANVPKYTVIPDPDFRIPDLYNMAGAPLSIVIGRDGKIAYRHEDFKEGDEKGIEEALAKALGETR